MKRVFSFVVAVAAMLAFSAGRANADQAIKLGPGPPTFTGSFDGKGALVFHCNPFFPGQGPGATPFIPGGAIRGNCPAAE